MEQNFRFQLFMLNKPITGLKTSSSPVAAHKLQREKIFALLIEARGQWVPLTAILDLRISQYNARIHELRKLGFCIENKTEMIEGKRCSWFRLLTGPQTSQPKRPNETAPAPSLQRSNESSDGLLFPIAMEHRDE